MNSEGKQVEQQLREHQGTRISLKYWKTNKKAFDLTQENKTNVGIELRAPVEKCVPAGGRTLINLGIGISVPPSYYGRITSIEENSRQLGIEVGGGVLDEDYRGDVCVLLYNHTNEDHIVKKGDVIAQLICQPIIYSNVILTE